MTHRQLQIRVAVAKQRGESDVTFAVLGLGHAKRRRILPGLLAQIVGHGVDGTGRATQIVVLSVKQIERYLERLGI